MSSRNPVTAWAHRSRRAGLSFLIGGVLVLFVLGLVSVCIGVADFDPVDLVRSGSQGRSLRLFLVSRVPRTLAAVLAGSGIAVAGAVMQMSVRNRFVSPTTAGTTQFAVVGLLLVALFAPSASVVVKMMVASACAVAGSAVFLWLLRLLPHRRTSDDVTIPLIGLMLGGVVEAGTTFVAWRYDCCSHWGPGRPATSPGCWPAATSCSGWWRSSSCCSISPLTASRWPVLGRRRPPDSG